MHPLALRRPPPGPPAPAPPTPLTPPAAHLIAAKPRSIPPLKPPTTGFAAIKPATNRSTARSTLSKRGFSRKPFPQDPTNRDCQPRISAAPPAALLIAAKPSKCPLLKPPKQGFAAIKPAISGTSCSTSSKLTNRLQDPCIHPPRPETPLRTSTATVHCKSAKRGFSPKPHLEETNHGVCQLRKCAVQPVSKTISPAPMLRTYAALPAAHLIAAKPPNLPDSMSPKHGFAAIKPAKLTNPLPPIAAAHYLSGVSPENPPPAPLTTGIVSLESVQHHGQHI